MAYASAVFHTNASLFAHMKQGTIVQNSTFPSALKLKGHDAWYYWSPGAVGAANPNPENIEEAPLLVASGPWRARAGGTNGVTFPG